jgi:signal transduction histidine kinase
MKAPPVTLRQRLLIGTLAWIFASIGLTAWMLNSLFRQHLERQFEAELVIHLNQLAANLDFDADGRPQLAHALSDPRLVRPYSGLYWQVDRVSREPRPDDIGVLRSRSLWDSSLSVPRDTPADHERHLHTLAGPKGESLRVVEQVLGNAAQPDQAARLIIAANENLLAEPLARFRGLLLGALGLLASGLIVAALVQVRGGLRPLNRLRDELMQLREGKQQALQGAYPGEIQPVVDELNAVLARNAEFVVRARQQADNLAHAVKTPLAVIANSAAEETGEFSALVGEQVGVARQQIDHHLAQVRITAASRLPGQRTSLRPVLEGLIRVMQRVHAERQLTLHMADIRDELLVASEAQDLQEMLGNLLDNACKWANTRVEITQRLTVDRVTIDIDDDGPGIAADQRANLLQRGIRGDEKVPGSGLGLAIVDELARLYGGQLTLLDAPLGGLRTRLCLPAAPVARLGNY